jgi:CheY-like chemotaxis protein
MMPKDVTAINVLLIEDSPGDVWLTRESFRIAHPSIAVHVASDGLEALAFLRSEGVHASAPRPDLILLDLNLPRLDGREVLIRIKGDDGLKAIPTIVLTDCEMQVDIVKSYQFQANCYLTKPVKLEAFQAIIKTIGDFWLGRVLLPGRADGKPAMSGP